MRKLFTLSIALGCMLATAVKSYGQAAGDYVFVQSAATDSLWATQANWKISDGNGGYSGDATSLPGATNNVWIAAGNKMGVLPTAVTNSVCTVSAGSTTVTLTTANTNIKAGMAVRNSDNFYGIAPGTYVTSVSTDGSTVTLSKAATRNLTKLSYFTACKSLNVNGSFRISAQFVAFGDANISSDGILFQNSDFYCKNINNYGNYIGIGGYRSAKNLYFGFDGAIPGTGDYTLVNDGIFGEASPMLPQGSRAGVRFLYSNQANSVTIKPSQDNITTGKINIAQLLPHSNMLTSANTTLNLKQSMSLLIHNGIGLSIQNNDSSLNTIRTCNISSGVTVYVGYNFHANRNVTTNPQGSFIYNIYGTLDLGTWATASNNLPPTGTTDFGLCMTTVTGNTGSLTFNLGDGTTSNAGTLILGSNIKLIKLRTQTINFNINDYSTVKVTGNSGQTMNYQLLNGNTPALYLFPKNYYNLIVDGAGVILPVAPNVKGTKTFKSGGYNAAANWVTGVTTTQGSIIKTSTGSYYYTPVIRSSSSYTGGATSITLDADTTMKYIMPNQTISATGISNYTISAVNGTSIVMSAAVSSSTTQQTNTTVNFSCKTGATEPTGTSTDSNNPVIDGTQGLIYLGATDFENATTALKTISQSNINVYTQNKNLIISNANTGDIVSVYNISGIKVASQTLTTTNASIALSQGIYIVRINNEVTKVIVK